MADTRSPTRARGPVTQRDILSTVREATRFLNDPSKIALDPIRYARVEAALEAIFASCTRSAIFSPFVLHNIGKGARKLLTARYDDWSAKKLADKTSAGEEVTA
jgi:hypothetical protein